MPHIDGLSTSQMAIGLLLAVPVALTAVTLLVMLLISTAMAVVGGVGWALSRASAAVFGESGEIWR